MEEFMKNIFEQKLNKAIYFTKPVEFLEIRSSGSQIYLTSRNTYAVWHKKKKIKGAMTNVFWLQSKYNKGTRTFDWFLKASDVCMTTKEALPIVKVKRMQYSEQRILDFCKLLASIFDPTPISAGFEIKEALKVYTSRPTYINFLKLIDIFIFY